MTAATGSMSLAEENLQNTLADCAAFRTLVGASGDDVQAQARARVHMETIVSPESGDIVYSVEELQKHRPCVLLGTADYDEEDSLIVTGRIDAQFYWDVPDAIAADGAEVMRRFRNTLGTIRSEMKVLARTGGYFDGTMSVDSVVRSAREAIPTQGDFVLAVVSFEWRGI